ncbi:MAG: hypothetical protein VX593_03175 [Pseudomonadota bacterium]|jgi:hypothetical protein|nr:hypothetical protein [Pseudomonadota bacterium]
MANGDAGKYLGWLVFAGVVGGLSYLNYSNTGRDLRNACMESDLPSGLGLSLAKADAVCSCVKDEGLSEFSPLAFVPVAGRIFAPSENEGYNIGVKSMALCASREADFEIPQSTLQGLLRDTSEE